MRPKSRFYSGKRVQKAGGGKRLRRRRWGLRSIALAGAAVCLLVVVCGKTYSYFSAKDRQINQFELSELDFVIEEPAWEEPKVPIRPGDVLPKDPQIVNTGETDFVVRVKLQEMWTPKNQDSILPTQYNRDYVRFFAANQGGEGVDGGFPAQQLLNILQADRQLEEAQKNFALRLALTPNSSHSSVFWDDSRPNGWYRGSSQSSEWLYYNQIVAVNQRTEPIVQAVTIRTGEDLYSIDDIAADESLEGDAYSEALQAAYEEALKEYNDWLTKYDLEIYVYAETVQADAFAWRDAWGQDLPAGWDSNWGGVGP